MFGDFNLFVSNNLPFCWRLDLASTNPSDGDTMTIKGVTFRFKTNTAANGDIKIGATVADTADNVVAALNALTTGSSTFDAWEDADTFTENASPSPRPTPCTALVATDGTTYVDLVLSRLGRFLCGGRSPVSAINMYLNGFHFYAEKADRGASLLQPRDRGILPVRHL